MTKRPRVFVVGLGPAGPALMTEDARQLLNSGRPCFLRTERHPAAAAASGAQSFDHIYEKAESIDEVYTTIVEALLQFAHEHGEIVYAVPGSPMVAESTVAKLQSIVEVDVTIAPSMSFIDLAWQRLGVDPLASSPRLIDGHRFRVEAAGERGPLLVGQCDAPWVLSDIKLAFEEDTPGEAVVLQRLGLVDESVTTVPWEELDKISPDHLTSLWIPELTAPVATKLARLDDIARHLRRECPWDAEQTHASLSRHILEETYELLEAIDGLVEEPALLGLSDTEEHLVEELGDVLFQVFAHAAIAAERGRFNIADIAEIAGDKLVERHPHVYGDVVAETAQDVVATWEENKRKAKGRISVMDGIPAQLPALAYATKVLSRAATTGVEIQPDELADSGPGGALLLLVQECRRQNVDAEQALRRATNSFRARFDQRRSPRLSPGQARRSGPSPQATKSG